MRPFLSLPVAIISMLLALCALLVVACSPTASVAPTPTGEPPTATQTATPVPPPATLTATTVSSPTPTSTASNTATPPPTRTATPTPTEPPTPEPAATATRAPTRRPTDTPAPVAAAPACPAWYQAPQPGKGVLFIANEMNDTTFIESLPGYPSPFQLSGTQSDVPVYITLQLTPGDYVFPFASASGGGSISFTIEADAMMLAEIYKGRRAREGYSPWVGHTSGAIADAHVGGVLTPYGCPGGLPPTPTPAPQCPAWFVTPAPEKGVLFIENRTNELLEVLVPDSKALVVKVPVMEGDISGIASVTLSPGHHEFEVSGGKRIVVDIGPGISVMVSYYSPQKTPALLPVYGAPAPPACPGYVPPTPPAPPQCPAWFERPQPGKAVLIVENHWGQMPVTIVGIKGIELEAILQPRKGDTIDRKILHLNPGHYEFGTTRGGFTADVEAGIVYSMALVDFPKSPQKATIIPLPPGCG
ncbi:MAG: hypothetical protein HZB53_08555 [Chloroflexi bacterium]|nr:hypothetical protein [Chloroflexota bacterium]